MAALWLLCLIGQARRIRVSDEQPQRFYPTAVCPPALPPARKLMTDSKSPIDSDRQRLLEAQSRGTFSTLGAYLRMSGPGWLQSAITLGGGSLSASLYLGVVAGFMFLWVQPLAMILGIIMLSAMSYVTLSTGERPFQAINKHVNPVLGWGWALASLSANMFWCLPQYALASSVMEQNLMPTVFGVDGSVAQSFARTFGEQSWMAANGAKLIIAGAILIFSTIITWSYDSGSWGIKLYEWILKLMVAGIVLCFFGVVFALRNELNWGELFAGFIPDFSKLFEPGEKFLHILKDTPHVQYWTDKIVAEQRDMIIGGAATAVGINMTFLFPYSLLRKRWTKEFRGLVTFDLATGMFIPFVLATSCVVIAAAQGFHAQQVQGFFGETNANGEAIVPTPKARSDYYGFLAPLVADLSQSPTPPAGFANVPTAQSQFDQWLNQLPESERAAISPETRKAILADFQKVGTEEKIALLPEVDRRVASMLINRSAFDLAKALEPLTGDKIANLVFGLGVLGMTLSTITILMLISGFVIVEMFNLPEGGWAHRLGCLAAATGALGPFMRAEAAFRLAVYVSAFGLMLLPIAYLSFFFLMNRKDFLKSEMPSGSRRLAWNLIMLVAAGITTLASVYTVWTKLGWGGISAYIAFILLALAVGMARKMKKPQQYESPY